LIELHKQSPVAQILSPHSQRKKRYPSPPTNSLTP
jgi:hypothetical protein